MLTDVALKALKPKDKIYKVADRDGMYVRVMPSGAISFRLDYRLNGRRETVYLGRYGRDGISLARAREKCSTRGAPLVKAAQDTSFKADTFEVSGPCSVRQTLQVEVEHLTRFGKPSGAITLDAQSESILFLHRGECRPRHQVLVDRSEGLAAVDPNAG